MALANAFPNTIVVTSHLLLEDDSIDVVDLVHFSQHARTQESSQLLGIDRVVLVSIFGDIGVALRITDDQLIDMRTEIPGQPTCHGTFFKG